MIKIPMQLSRSPYLLIAVSFLTANLAFADQGKGASAQETAQPILPGNSYFHTHDVTRLNLPKDRLPPPGECRVWYRDRSAGQQLAPMKCNAELPRGAWLIRHPQEAPDIVVVTVFKPRFPGVVRAIGEFSMASGTLVRVLKDK